MNNLIKNRNFIIFGEDFERHPHALEHLLRPLFNENKFIWVETIGLRSPKFNLYDLKRIWEKLSNWSNQNQQSQNTFPSNINIVRPFMIPFNQFTIIRKFNQWSVNKSINQKINELNFNEIITIASVPNAADYVGNYNEKLKLYFCVDEFSLWPGLDYNLVSKLEKKLIEKSDYIIATSTALTISKKKANKTTELIGHGVEFEHFNIGIKPIDQKSLKICYFGLFDERNNQDIIREIALDLPNDQIDIIGNVVCNIARLEGLKNVRFKGAVNYKELPKEIKQYDIFILPYVENELTRNINPLKLKEYISTSRFIISTPLPEVVKYNSYISIAKNGSEFISLINQYRNNPNDLNLFDPIKSINYIKENETWDSKAARLSNLIKQFEH